MSPADDLEIGFTGARFGGAPRRRRRSARRSGRAAGEDRSPAAEGTPARREADEPDTVALPAPAPAGAPASEIGTTGARFGGAPRRRRAPGPEAPGTGTPASVSGPEPEPQPEVASRPDSRPAAESLSGGPVPSPEPQPAPNQDEPVDDRAGRSMAVRPYFHTRGRTRSRYELAIETLVSALPAAVDRPELAEHRPILELCGRPRSIAEIAAITRMPLGVARVVVGDLAVAGGLAVHRTVPTAGPDVTLMERVLSGLRRL